MSKGKKPKNLEELFDQIEEEKRNRYVKELSDALRAIYKQAFEDLAFKENPLLKLAKKAENSNESDIFPPVDHPGGQNPTNIQEEGTRQRRVNRKAARPRRKT